MINYNVVQCLSDPPLTSSLFQLTKAACCYLYSGLISAVLPPGGQRITLSWLKTDFKAKLY